MEVVPTKSYVVRAYPNGQEIIDKPFNIKNKFSKIQLECMARNIYYESRGQGRLGMQAVGYVTMNRVYSGEYPSSICGVVYQGERTKKGVLYKCQFSWVCDGTVKNIRSKSQWKLAKELALEVANTYTPKLDPTKGSLFYHASYLKRPFKRMNVVEVVRINEHVFYKKRRA
jgi:spore germination cell wall hydrolase CwlJ-like protein